MSKMNTTEVDSQRKYTLLKMFFTLSLLVNILKIIFFLNQKYFDLLFLALVDSCIFVMNFFLLRKKMFLLSLQIGIVDIVVTSIIETFFLGWNSNFSLYLITSAILVINSLSISPRVKLFETILILILFMGCTIFTKDGYSKYILDPVLLKQVGLFNLLAVIFVILFMEFQNFRANDHLRNTVELFSEIDPLTGLYNRRFFNKYLDIEIKRQESQVKYHNSRAATFGIAMIDIDDFKKVNDKYGHLVGDTVLAEVAHIIGEVIFERDIICRYGGEEFVVLFTNTSKSGAMIAVEKIIKAVENYDFLINKENSKFHITVSIGLAGFDEESNIWGLLGIADERLYTAKKLGKNRAIYE